MADKPNEQPKQDEGSIDYNKSQADVDKAKQEQRDADAKRLREESE